jgi:hypothetical protein
MVDEIDEISKRAVTVPTRPRDYDHGEGRFRLPLPLPFGATII